jgi:ParB-like chromosome segregation protein Spo0J
MELLPIEKIRLRPDARSIEAATVLGLTESIATVGLINPIRVRAVDDGWEVIAGAHRLAACANLGLVEIGADVVADNDLLAELAMIDENLCRAELSPADRARQTARRKAIYIELHPETENGATGVGRGPEERAERFTSETAKVTGNSERVVQRNAERGEKVIGEVLDLIKGTSLDSGSYLDKIKKLPPNEQMKAATRDLAFANQRHRQDERAKTEAAKRNKLQGDIKLRAASAIGEWIAQNVGDDLEFVLSNLHAAGASNIAHVVSGLCSSDRSAA